MDGSSPGLPVHYQFPEFTQTHSIESVMPSNFLIFCCPLFLPPSVFPSIRVFSNESVLPIRLPNYWSFSFSISLSNEYSGVVSFRTDWLDLLAVQGTLESSPTPLFKSINSLALSFLYTPTLTFMTTRKTIVLTRWTFVGKKCLCFLICCLGCSYLFFQGASIFSWLQSPSAVILEPKNSLSLFPVRPHLFIMK